MEVIALSREQIKAGKPSRTPAPPRETSPPLTASAPTRTEPVPAAPRVVATVDLDGLASTLVSLRAVEVVDATLEHPPEELLG